MKDSIKQEYSKAKTNIFGLQGLPMMATLLMVKEWFGSLEVSQLKWRLL